METKLDIIDKKYDNVKFTKDQEIAVNNLIDFIGEAWNPLNYINSLCGAGGTGKTFVTKYVIDNCKFSNSVILCTAPTHKACRVLSNSIGGRKVETIQSTFGLRLDINIDNFDPNNPAFNPIGKDKLENIRLLIVDEASMLNFKLVKYIAQHCKSKEIKVLFLGDASQLPPVNETSSYAFKISSRIFYLNEIVRQGINNPVSKLLELLRYDIEHKGTWKFLEYIGKNRQAYNEESAGYYVCRQSEFIDLVDTCFNDDEYTKNIDLCRVIAYTNNRVNQWNNHIRHKIIADADKSIITKNDLIMSYVTVVDDFNDIMINNSEEYVIHDMLDTVDKHYDFVGFLVKFQAIHGGDICRPLFVINHNDPFTFQMYHKVVNDLMTAAKSAVGNARSEKWKAYFKFKRKYLLAVNSYDSMGREIIKRDLDYGFALTSHKSQGSTYKTVFVDVNDIIYDKHGHPYTNRDEMLRRLYVACSRASNNLVLSYGQ